MDDFLVEIREKIGDDEDTVLMVISDHGFTNFRRGVNLNAWLRDEGYLHLKDGEVTSPDWFAKVDWEKTKAFTLGLTGVFINRKGREAHGIVEKGAELDDALCAEIKEQARGAHRPARRPAGGEGGLRHPPDPRRAVRRHGARDPGRLPQGLPPLVGLRDRARSRRRSSATTPSPGPATTASIRASCPGVFWCNRKINTDEPALLDMAPTVLDLFGPRDVPRYMQGQAALR